MNLDYACALENQPICIQLVAADGGLLHLNQAGRKVLGIGSLDAAKGRSFIDFVTPKHRAACQALISRVFLGQSDSMVLSVITPSVNSGVEWMELHGSPLRNNHGQVTALLGILQQTSAPPPTCQEQDWLQWAFDQSNDAIFLADQSFRFIRVNDAACRSLGYSHKEILRMSVWDIHPDATPETLANMLQHLQSQGHLAPFETWHRARDGRVFPVEATWLNFAQDHSRLVLCRVRDLTERRRWETDLRAKEMSLLALMDGLPDFIVRYDRQCRRVALNSAARTLIGLPLEQIVGRTPEELPFHNTAWFIEVLRGVLAGGKPWLGDTVYTDANEGTHWGELRVLPEFGPDGMVTGAVSVWRDTTQLRQLQNQLRQAQKLEAIGQLVGGVAHDFNNMLAAILLHVSLLRTDPRLPADLVEVFEELEEDARRATSLPRQLLMFSRQQAIQARAVLMESVIETTLKMLRRIVSERIRIDFRPAKMPAYIFCDPGMMEQVVFNLCLNARDAMPNGGRITLATRLVEVGDQQAAKIKDARPGRFVRFTVADTGCGMDAVTLSKIFEPFFTTKESGCGTGLGLMTVFGIVQQHQGWIQVESVVGRGTKFFIFLPVHAQKTNSHSPREETVPAPRGRGETILLVEDEVSLRQVLAVMMSRSGYQVLEAANAVEAADLWGRHRSVINLLFSDVVIPGDFSGLDLARRFRQDKPDLPVILSSGYKSGTMLPADSAVSRITFLAKPVLWNELASALHSALGSVS